ncbi:MAG: DAHL domain-containing protein, partial [Ghiorsea sp.]
MIIGLGALLVLAVMFGPEQKTSEFVHQNQAAIQDLNHMQQLNQQLNQAVLETHLFHEKQFTALHQLSQKIQDTLQRLQLLMSPWLTDKKLGDLQEHLQKKVEHLEQLERNDDLLASKLVLLEQQQKNIQKITGKKQQEVLYSLLYSSLMGFSYTDAEKTKQLEIKIQYLLRLDTTLGQKHLIQGIVQSVTSVLDVAKIQREEIQSLLSASFQSQLTWMIDDFDKVKQESASQVQHNRRSLMLLALLLLAYIAFIIIRLRNASAHLENSMRDLEYLKFALDQHAIVTMTDAQGKITYANDNLCKMSQYAQEELIGNTHQLL